VTPDRRAYMRDYMRRRREKASRKPASGDAVAPGASKVYRDVPQPISPRARKQSLSNGPARWADNEHLWEHPDGKIRNYPPGLDSGKLVETSWGRIRAAL
jgi:hypothetical protein